MLEVRGSGTGNGTLVDPRLQLFSPQGLLVGEDGDGGTSRDSRLTYVAAVSGTYYLSAESQSGTGTGTYQARARVLDATTSDPLLINQWHLNNTGQSGGTVGIDIRAFTAWQDYSGYGVRVGVIDDGVQSTHPDLDANTDTTTDYDARDNDNNADASASDDAHGVAVAGLIAAERFNGIGVVGVAYDATIVGFRMGYGSNGTLDQITNNFSPPDRCRCL